MKDALQTIREELADTEKAIDSATQALESSEAKARVLRALLEKIDPKGDDSPKPLIEGDPYARMRGKAIIQELGDMPLEVVNIWAQGARFDLLFPYEGEKLILEKFKIREPAELRGMLLTVKFDGWAMENYSRVMGFALKRPKGGGPSENLTLTFHIQAQKSI